MWHCCSTVLRGIHWCPHDRICPSNLQSNCSDMAELLIWESYFRQVRRCHTDRHVLHTCLSFPEKEVKCHQFPSTIPISDLGVTLFLWLFMTVREEKAGPTSSVTVFYRYFMNQFKHNFIITILPIQIQQRFPLPHRLEKDPQCLQMSDLTVNSSFVCRSFHMCSSLDWTSPVT